MEGRKKGTKEGRKRKKENQKLETGNKTKDDVDYQISSFLL